MRIANLHHVYVHKCDHVFRARGRGRHVARPEGEGATVFEVDTEPGRDVRAELSAAVVSRGLGLLGLHQVGMSLEDIFLELTTTDSATAPAVAPAEVQA